MSVVHVGLLPRGLRCSRMASGLRALGAPRPRPNGNMRCSCVGLDLGHHCFELLLIVTQIFEDHKCLTVQSSLRGVRVFGRCGSLG